MSRYMDYPLIVPKNSSDNISLFYENSSKTRQYSGSVSFNPVSTAQNVPIHLTRTPYTQFILSNENPYVLDVRKSESLPLSKQMTIFNQHFRKQF
jgi:hypothetical protein